MAVKIHDTGCGNSIVGSFESDSDVSIVFKGNNNEIIIGPNVILKSSKLNFRHSDQKIVFRGSNRLICDLNLSGESGLVEFGEGSSSNGLVWMNVGEKNDSIIIGNNCLFSHVKFRTSDSHPIYDLISSSRINPSSSIKVGDRVWIAEDTLILKGVEIGNGTAVGARSTVTKSLPCNALCVGTPARPIREGIRWEEKFPKN